MQIPFWLTAVSVHMESEVKNLTQTRLGVDKVKPKGWFKYF